MHHIAASTSSQAHLPLYEAFVLDAMPPDPARQKPGKRGAPLKISWPHLWFRLIFCVLGGMQNYQDLRRDLALGPLGPFPALQISDDALIRRLQRAGLAPLHYLLRQLSQRLSGLIERECPCDLAPFATSIQSVDETAWDVVQRHLLSLRQMPTDSVELRPGKMAGRFNIRTQLWEFVQFRDNPQGNCKLDVCSLLEGLAVGTLLLFDLGYFSYAFFDYLTEMGYWYISRLREDACYQIVAPLYRHEGTLDALVWLGGTGRNGSRTGRLVRLVRFWDGRGVRSYLTNQIDPHLLPLPDIARLYARRWDIELAFLTLKKHLGLHHWWSAIPVLRQQQALVVLIVAQLLNATRLLIAAQQGCDPFEVSFPLLVVATPHVLQQRLHPVGWAAIHGQELGLFRPSTRFQVQVPDPPLHQYTFPPADLPRTRLAHYREYPPRPHRTPIQQKKSPPAVSTAGVAKQLSLFPPSVLHRLKEVHK